MKIHTKGRSRGFTLIEMMAVITIIVLLAGIVVGSMGYVNERQAREKARTQLAMLSKAIEDYHLDNGFYPFTRNSDKNSSILFNALWWDTDGDGVGAVSADGKRLDEDQPVYLPELDPENNKQGWTEPGASVGRNTILDPWGNEYRYTSGTNSRGSANRNAQNPDFDLWSVGKDGATDARNPSSSRNDDDVWID